MSPRKQENQKPTSEYFILHIWVFPKIRGTPKWMVKIMEKPYYQWDDLEGKPPILGKHPHISSTLQLCFTKPPPAARLEVECVASPVSWSPKRQQFLTSERPSLSPQKLPADLPLNLWNKTDKKRAESLENVGHSGFFFGSK